MNLIDRDKLIEEIKANGETMIFSGVSQHDRDDEKREFAINMLLDAPIINTVRVAHWINIVRGTGTCSNCNEKVKFP